MTYTVSWDGPSADEPSRGNKVQVSTETELDAVLDQVTTQAADDGLPYAVQVHRADAPGSVMIGIGHPDRSMLDWLVATGEHEYGYEPDLPPWPEPIAFDVYGNWHERDPNKVRITPSVARNAAREYVRTGRKPTGAAWAADE